MPINPVNTQPAAAAAQTPTEYLYHPRRSKADSLTQIQAEFAQLQSRLSALNESPSALTPTGEPIGAIALPVVRQPVAVPTMRVPSPVYINPVPDVHVHGVDYDYTINNAQVHVQHNRRADAQYEAVMDMVGPPRVGRAAVWWAHEYMPYTADVANTGISETDFQAFWRGCDSIVNEGRQRVFSLSNTIITMLTCGICIVCDPSESFHAAQWSAAHIGYRMGEFCNNQNRELEAKGVRAIFRANHVPGMGFKLELHHAG